MQVKKDSHGRVMSYSVDDSLTTNKVTVIPSSRLPSLLVVGDSQSALTKEGVRDLIRALAECL